MLKSLFSIVVLSALLSACQFLPAKPPVEPVAPVAACECPAPEPLAAPVCPSVEPVVIKVPVEAEPAPVVENSHDRYQGKWVIGQVEHVLVQPNLLTLEARIDTGATTSSMNAIDLTYFERDGKDWVRFAMTDPKTQQPVTIERKVKRHILVKQLSGKSQRRPVVVMGLVMGPLEEQVELTLIDRSGYDYQLLIGRNFLRDRAIVDVSKGFVAHTLE